MSNHLEAGSYEADTCAHCGLSMRGASADQLNRPTAANEPSFCCNGCQGAYELIHGWGLTEFYALRDQLGGDESSANGSRRQSFEAFDTDDFLGKAKPRELSNGLLTATLAIHGLHCAACAWLIENAALQTPGLIEARVRLNDHTIRLVYDSKQLKLSQIAQLLDRLGYELAPPTHMPDEHFRNEHRRLLIQIAIAGFCAANAMWIAIALYAGEAGGLAAQHAVFLRMTGSVLGLAAVVFPGRTFFKGAFAAIRTRTPHMDLPVALGLAVGSTVGILNAILGRGAVYFDSLAVLVFLLLIGRWIQFRQQHRAARAVELLLRITPQHANRINASSETETVLVDNLEVGDRVRVLPGESFPVDGVIHRGKSTVDRSLLTGESTPITIEVGDEVLAGMVNLSRSVDIETEAVGSDSRAGKIMQAVDQAIGERIPIIQLADRIGGVFVMVVTLLAVMTFLIWVSTDWLAAAENATSLLIVACPCALALATPLAIAISIGRAAKRKIFVRDGAVFQQMARTGVIWFDKTGTLTEGRPNIQELHGEKRALGLAAALERECCHPIADAIVTAAAHSDCDNNLVAESVEVHDSGVTGVCGGSRVAVGNRLLMQTRGIDVGVSMGRIAESVEAQGVSPIMIAIDGWVVTVITLADPIKHDAAGMVSKIRQMGWRVGMLSGDNSAVVARVANQVGIEPTMAYGDLSPEQKVNVVKKGAIKAGGTNKTPVIMVGDGANDAAALAAADVGIAVRGGAEVSLQAAPVYVSAGELSVVASLIRAARSSRLLIYTTFGVSITYNLIAVTLAVMGQISPLIAAILMPISSVTVLTITLAWPVFLEQKK